MRECLAEQVVAGFGLGVGLHVVVWVGFELRVVEVQIFGECRGDVHYVGGCVGF